MYAKVKFEKNGGYGFAFKKNAQNTIFVAKMA